jgi:hypothetical protein
MELLPNELIEQIYTNLDMNDSVNLSLTSKAINECRPSYLIKHRSKFIKVIDEINKIKYEVIYNHKGNRIDEFKIKGCFGNPNIIRCVNKIRDESVREINGRVVIIAVVSDTLKSNPHGNCLKFEFNHIIEICSTSRSSGKTSSRLFYAPKHIQGAMSKYFSCNDRVYVYSYKKTQELLING